MKSFYKITLLILAIITLVFSFSSAGVVDIPTQWIDKVTSVSIDKWASGNIVEDINSLGFSLLKTFKLILQWLLVIYIVYVWVTMIISMWTDEDKLTKSKNQLWYSLIALVFINIPGTIYGVISNNSRWSVNDTDWEKANIFLNIDLLSWEWWIIWQIVSFMEVIIFGLALFVMVLAGISIMVSRWRDEKVKEAKEKILYSLVWLVFVWFIEAWKQLAIQWDVSFGNDIFGNIVDIALVFAWPVAIIFLTLAGYYYITSNGDEERVKKSKSIIVNTLIGVILLIVMATFLNDLLTL